MLIVVAIDLAILEPFLGKTHMLRHEVRDVFLVRHEVLIVFVVDKLDGGEDGLGVHMS